MSDTANRPLVGIGVSYLIASLVAGTIISGGVIVSDIPDAGWPSLGSGFGFFLTGLIFTAILALIAFVPLRIILYQFRFASSVSFVLAGAFEGAVVGYLFIQGFDLAWVLVLAGSVAGAVQWKLENRFVGEIFVKPEMSPSDE